MEKKVSEKYVPGVCNIDAGGREKRALFGIAMLVVSVLLWNYLRALNNTEWQLLVVIPLWVGFIGLWQAYFSFCVGDAAKHRFDINGRIVNITDERHIEKDRQKAMQINTISLASAILAIAALFFINGWMK